MTHLRIEQSTGVIEEVNLSIISKLYELAYAGLDASSNLLGRLHTPVSYRSEVQYLTTNFPNLYITSDDYAMPFEDPNMVTYLNNLGIGSNGAITENQAAAVTSIASDTANTTVTKFNELKYFTAIELSTSGGITGQGSKYINFTNWTALEEVDISNFASLGHSHAYAYDCNFGGCTALETVIASNKLEVIGVRAFYNCSNLETISGLSGEISVYGNAFYNCLKLTSDNFTNVSVLLGLSTNGRNGEFLKCIALTSITLSPNNEMIPIDAFNGCTNLSSINLENVKYLGSLAFLDCTSLQGVINLPSIIEVGYGAAGSLMRSAFLNCPGITEVHFGPNLTLASGASMFRNCSSLTTVTGLSNITYLGESAFANCSNLESLDLDFTKCVSFSTNGSLFLNCSKITSISSIGTGKIPILVEKMFMGCSALTTIDLSGVNTASGGSWVRDCTNLTTVTTDWTNVSYIGGRAFSGDIALTTIDLTGITKVNESAFNGCTSLATITGASGITLVGVEAFKGCNELTSLSLGTLTTTPGTGAFRGCSKLTSITGLSQLTDIPLLLFYDDNSLTSVDINWANITSISNEVFVRTKIGGNIVLNSCTTIGTLIFSNTLITSFIAPELTSLGNNSLTGCKNLEFVYLPKLTEYNGGCSNNPSDSTQIGFNGNTTIVEFGPNLTSMQYINNNNLKKTIVFRSNTPPSFIGTVYNAHYQNMTLYVPDDYISDYQNHSVWSKASSILPLSQYTRPATYDALIPTT